MPSCQLTEVLAQSWKELQSKKEQNTTRHREEVQTHSVCSFPPPKKNPKTTQSFSLPLLITNTSKWNTTCLNPSGNKSTMFWWEDRIGAHREKGKGVSPGENHVHRAAATWNCKAAFTLPFICDLVFRSGKTAKAFKGPQEIRHAVPITLNEQRLPISYTSGTYRAMWNRSITPGLLSCWKSQVNYFFQQYLHRREPDAHWQVPCTGYMLLEWILLRYQVHLPVQTSPHPLASLPLSFRSFRQGFSWPLHASQSPMHIHLSTLWAIWCSFIPFTDAMVLGSSKNHKVLLQKSPLCMKMDILQVKWQLRASTAPEAYRCANWTQF